MKKTSVEPKYCNGCGKEFNSPPSSISTKYVYKSKDDWVTDHKSYPSLCEGCAIAADKAIRDTWTARRDAEKTPTIPSRKDIPPSARSISFGELGGGGACFTTLPIRHGGREDE